MLSRHLAPSRNIVDRSALEKLAKTWSRPVETVEQLYKEEVSSLERQARVHAFVPVVALRRVRERLRGWTRSRSEQGAPKRYPVQPSA
jgi:hypothetical protein